ncbi:TPA: phage tail protein [Mannheimia haemolytica]
MTTQFYSLITKYGESVIAQAVANNTPVPLKTMAIGDGNGTPTTPSESQTTLINEVYRAEITDLLQDSETPNQVIAELLVPETVGGFTVREVGIYDNQNKLVAVANCPENYKPVLEQGSGKVQYYRIVLRVSSSDAVTLSLNNNIVYATRLEFNRFVNDLSKPDGFKLVGECESIAQLRTIEPTADQQRILVKSYHAGKNLGGGVFYADFADTTTADNAGTVIVTAGGKRWNRLDAVSSPYSFGAIGDGKTDDTAALQACINANINRPRSARLVELGTGHFAFTSLNISSALFGLTIKGDAMFNTRLICTTPAEDGIAIDVQAQEVEFESIYFDNKNKTNAANSPNKVGLNFYRGDGEKVDIDCRVADCFFNGWFTGINHKGRGLKVTRSLFTACNIGIDLDFPNQGTFPEEDASIRAFKSAWRAIVLTDIRGHGINTSLIANTKNNAQWINGLVVNNLLNDTGGYLFKGHLGNGANISQLNSQNSLSAILELSGGKGFVLSDVTGAGSYQDDGRVKPLNLINITGGDIEGIANNVILSQCRGSAVVATGGNFNLTISNLRVSDWGLANSNYSAVEFRRACTGKVDIDYFAALSSQKMSYAIKNEMPNLKLHVKSLFANNVQRLIYGDTSYTVLNAPTIFDWGISADGQNETEALSRTAYIDKAIDGLGKTIICDSLPINMQYFKNCRFKVGKLHYPTADYYQADFAKVTNGGIYMSHPQDTAYILGNQIKMWISTANAHLDSGVQPAMLMSEDGGTSYQAPALLDITRKQNTIWSAGVANGVEYLFERMTDVAPFSYRLHKRVVPAGDKANYYEPFTTSEITFAMPSWSRDVQPVMIHSFAEFPGGFVVGASFTEGAGLYKSTDGGATYQFIELKQGSNYEEPTVKYANGVFAGFIRGGSDGARPSFWLSRDNLATIKVFTAPDNVFLNSKLQDVCIPLALVNNTVHGFGVARNGVEAGLSDEYAPIYYIKADISRTDNIWSNAEISLLGYCYHAEQGGASACGQGSVVVYRNKLMFYYGSEERTGANKTGNRIANIHCITLPLSQSATAVNFDDKVEILRAAEYYQTADGRMLLPHGKTVLRRERLATQKYNQAPNIADDLLIVGNASSAGVTVLTDGPYSSFLSLDHENKMAGFRVDNTNGAVQILAKGEIVLLYDPATKSFYPKTKNEVELGKAGNALKHIYVQSGTIDTPEVNANDNEIVNAKWVNRQWSSSRGDIGWTKRPDGLIEQWGTIYIGANGTATVSLPIAFPSKFFNVVLTPDKPRNGYYVAAKTLNNFELKNTEGTECNYTWRAFGY